MNEKQRAISDLLRSADKVIKTGKLEDAMKYINKVIDLDQRNVYAKAYTERIISLLEAQGMTRKDALRITAEAKFSENVAPAPTETPAPKIESIPAPQTLPQVEKIELLPNLVPEPVQETIQPQKIVPPPIAPPSATYATPYIKGLTTIKRTAAAIEAYKTLLMEIWKDGLISEEELARVESMRETFAITQDEHLQIEKEVRMSSYLNSMRSEWQRGNTNFEPLRTKYRISDQEQITLEPKVMQLVQSLQSNGSVLILDDDTAFLNVIKQILQDGGYYCFTCASGEEGLQFLETMTPDIVICDINFSKPHMSGFAFYERFRSNDKFVIIPFIFLSALDQDVLVRTGKKLGADDYITKPIDTEMLLATIEGKLRRTRELRRVYE